LVDQDVDAAPVAVKDPPGAVKCAAVWIPFHTGPQMRVEIRVEANRCTAGHACIGFTAALWVPTCASWVGYTQ
jgi:hypothetical protein